MSFEAFKGPIGLGGLEDPLAAPEIEVGEAEPGDLALDADLAAGLAEAVRSQVEQGSPESQAAPEEAGDAQSAGSDAAAPRPGHGGSGGGSW